MIYDSSACFDDEFTSLDEPKFWRERRKAASPRGTDPIVIGIGNRRSDTEVRQIDCLGVNRADS